MLYNTGAFSQELHLRGIQNNKMIICPFCQAEQVDNTIYCNECGHYLLSKADKRKTEHYDRDDIHSTFNLPTQPKSSLPPALTGPVVIQLKIISNQREVQLALDKKLLFGRIDPALGVFPDIDLTVDGSLAKSVSRRHATVSRQDDKIVVEDLGSVNGTFINGQRLDPYVPNSINDGDILQLGKLPVEFKIRK